MDDEKLSFLPNYVGFISAGANNSTLDKPSKEKLANIVKRIIDNPDEIRNFLSYHLTTDIYNSIVCEISNALNDLEIEHCVNKNQNIAQINVKKSACELEIQIYKNYLGSRGCSVFKRLIPSKDSLCNVVSSTMTLPDIQIFETEKNYCIFFLEEISPRIVKNINTNDAVAIVVEYIINESLGGCKCLKNNL